MKNKQFVSTPYGDFQKTSYKQYQYVSIWCRYHSFIYEAVWHSTLGNVEKCPSSKTGQLMGVWRVEPWRSDSSKIYSQQVKYVV